MPAKGWRKDEQESNLETALANQKVSIDSILFPKATIMKLVKRVLAEESPDANPMILAKEAQTVIQRASVLYINYIYHNAKQSVKAKGRKVVNADDIVVAVRTTDFDSFVPVLEAELEHFNERKAQKAKERELRKAAAAEEQGTSDSKRAKVDGDGEGDDTKDEEDQDATKDDDDDEEEEEEGEEEEEADSNDEEEEEETIHTSQIEKEQKELAGDEPEDEEQGEEEDED